MIVADFRINVVHVLSSLIRATKVELLNGMEINKW